MQIASSANRTCRLCRSASEYTATVRIPSSLHAQMTRTAISPRLAIRIFSNMGLTWFHGEQRFPVFHGTPILDKLADDHTAHLGFDLVHQLHRFDDADNLTRLNI